MSLLKKRLIDAPTEIAEEVLTAEMPAKVKKLRKAKGENYLRP